MLKKENRFKHSSKLVLLSETNIVPRAEQD